MKDCNEDLTIFTTTRNRKESIEIAIKYYSDVNFKGKFLIIDASDEIHEKDFKNSKVDYYWHKGISVIDAYAIAGMLCRTKYMMFLGDDDFLLPNGSRKILESMIGGEQNAAGFGKSMWIYYQDIIEENNIPVDATKNMKRWMLGHKLNIQLNIIKGSHKERLHEIFDNYRVYQFAIITVDLWRKIYNKEYQMLEDDHIQEIASSIAICLESAQYRTEKYYMLRGTGHSRPNTLENHENHKLPNLNEMIERLEKYAISLNYGEKLTKSFANYALCLRVLGDTNYYALKSACTKEERIKLSKERIDEIRKDEVADEISKLITLLDK